MKVLIVDDSSVMRIIVKRTMRIAGFERHAYLEASDDIEAIEVVRNDHPDLVLCDWQLPSTSGLDFLKRLRTDGFAMPFGFIAKDANEAMRASASGAGARFLLARPFTSETFREALDPLLSRVRTQPVLALGGDRT